MSGIGSGPELPNNSIKIKSPSVQDSSLSGVDVGSQEGAVELTDTLSRRRLSSYFEKLENLLTKLVNMGSDLFATASFEDLSSLSLEDLQPLDSSDSSEVGMGMERFEIGEGKDSSKSYIPKDGDILLSSSKKAKGKFDESFIYSDSKCLSKQKEGIQSQPFSRKFFQKGRGRAYRLRSFQLNERLLDLVRMGNDKKGRARQNKLINVIRDAVSGLSHKKLGSKYKKELRSKKKVEDTEDLLEYQETQGEEVPSLSRLLFSMLQYSALMQSADQTAITIKGLILELPEAEDTDSWLNENKEALLKNFKCLPEEFQYNHLNMTPESLDQLLNTLVS